MIPSETQNIISVSSEFLQFTCGISEEYLPSPEGVFTLSTCILSCILRCLMANILGPENQPLQKVLAITKLGTRAYRFPSNYSFWFLKA